MPHPLAHAISMLNIKIKTAHRGTLHVSFTLSMEDGMTRIKFRPPKPFRRFDGSLKWQDREWRGIRDGPPKLPQQRSSGLSMSETRNRNRDGPGCHDKCRKDFTDLIFGKLYKHCAEILLAAVIEVIQDTIRDPITICIICVVVLSVTIRHYKGGR